MLSSIQFNRYMRCGYNSKGIRGEKEKKKKKEKKNKVQAPRSSWAQNGTYIVCAV